MAIPAILAGSGAAAAGLGELSALLAPHLGKILLGSALVAPSVIGQIDKSGERKLSREQIALQKALMEAQKEATRRQVTESRSNARSYIRELKEAQKTSRMQNQEDALLAALMKSQDRQAQAVTQAVLGLAQTTSRPSQGYAGPASLLGLMRS